MGSVVISAEFIGRDGSRGFQRGKLYDIEVISNPLGYLTVYRVHGWHFRRDQTSKTHYTNRDFFDDNWNFQRYIEAPDQISNQGA